MSEIFTGPIIRNIDIETAPNVAHVWGVWKQNIAPNQILEHDRVMSFAYKDLGDSYTYYLANEDGTDEGERELIKELIAVMDEADIVVGHNFKSFDDRWIIGKALMHGLKPPSPYKIVDTLVEARKYMRLKSYKLAEVAKALKVAPKSEHAQFPGHLLWSECLKGNPKAWAEMELYNRQDVETGEEVYLALRPYMRNHPNVGIYMDLDRPVCSACGSDHLHRRGYAYTDVSKFQRTQCQDCGHWDRFRMNVFNKHKRKQLVTGVR